uniref:Uncharacterized protein n=1 Tax=Nelumbo nucifera TaxID=4432 RepID=A0A822YIP8_NELNU|nr:TPA_asm: hypothetical protein HUJ06_030746 [Nelumbo nucifera]
MWRVWKEGGTWFLYWGAKCYEKANVASAEIRFRCGLPPGDVVLFYPGEVFSSSHQLVASVRLERILSGLQEMKRGKRENLSLSAIRKVSLSILLLYFQPNTVFFISNQPFLPLGMER